MAAMDEEEHSSDLQAWRETHGLLVEAVQAAQAAVAEQRAKRRFWMEEICANIGQDGQLVSTSIWKRPVPFKKGASGVVRKYSTTKQRKKKEGTAEKAPKKPRKRKASTSSEPKSEDCHHDEHALERKPSKPKKIKISLKRPPSPAEETEDSGAGEEDDDEDEDGGDIPHAQPLHGSEYPVDAMAYHHGHPPPHHPPHQWSQQGAQSLQLMAAVAFGANLANPPYPPQHGPPPGMMPPHQQAYAHHPHHHGHPPPHHHHHHHPHHHPYMGGPPPPQPVYHPQGGRTYADINDVGESDDESDQEKF